MAVSPAFEDVSVNRTEDRIVTSADITQYLEKGHRIRPPSGRAKRYQPRIRSGRLYVPGRQFHSWTKPDAMRAAVPAARKGITDWLEELAELDDA